MPSTFSRCVFACSLWLGASCLLPACAVGEPPGPGRQNTKAAKKKKAARQERKRARKQRKERIENRTGGIELAAFAGELESALTGKDMTFLRAALLDEAVLDACEFSRERGSVSVPPKDISDFLSRERSELERIETATPAPESIAVVHKLRAQKRIIGAVIRGADCPVESRGRITIVAIPDTAPPDAVETKFETIFVAGNWKLIGVDRIERDCSPLGTPNTVACRALASRQSSSEPAPP